MSRHNQERKTKMKKPSKNNSATAPGKFQTPHELKSETKQSKTSRTATAKTTKSGHDAFGGRLGSRMSKINLVVINAGAKGACVPEVAQKTGEKANIVSAQLGWMVSHVKVATRKEETFKGKQTFRYFAKLN
jgi:hypothetical protein